MERTNGIGNQRQSARYGLVRLARRLSNLSARNLGYGFAPRSQP